MEARDIQKQFGLRVKALRKEKGLTQEQLSAAIDKSVDTISNVERGFSSTRIRTAEDIANVLGVTVAELFLSVPITGKETPHQKFMNHVGELTQNCDPRTLDAVLGAIQIVMRVSNMPKPE